MAHTSSNPLKASIIWKNGLLLPAPQLSLHDRGLLYGDAFFTTAAVAKGQIGLLSYHEARLKYAAKQLSFVVNWNALKSALMTFAQIIDTGVIKILISRGIGIRGYVTPNQPADFYFYGDSDISRLNILNYPALQSPIQVITLDSLIGSAMPKLAGIKTVNRLEQVVLRQELAEQAQEGLVFDQNMTLISGVSSNCFYYMSNQWYKPSLKAAGIWGTCRAFLLDQFQKKGIFVEHYNLAKNDTFKIESLFFSNALGIYPAASLNQRKLDQKKIDILFNQLYS